MSNNELRGNRQFLRSKAKGFLSDLEGHTVYFEDYTARSDGENISYGVTLTFTHADVSRLFRNRFVREDSNPALTFTLHVTRHSDTSSLNLPSGKPMRVEALNAEASECKLKTTLGIAFAATFLRSSIFSSFRL